MRVKVILDVIVTSEDETTEDAARVGRTFFVPDTVGRDDAIFSAVTTIVNEFLQKDGSEDD